MTQDEAFKAWWYSEGSQAPYTHHDCEEHTMRMCEIAWANGAYKERETLAQTQEPVPPPWWPAVENILTEYGLQAIDFVADFKQALAQTQEPIAVLFGSLPVYDRTTPPQRTWVGLTVDELIDLEHKHLRHEDLARAIESKLREKNSQHKEKNT